MSLPGDPFSPDLRHLASDVRQLVEEELWPSERIRWIGQPRSRRQIWERLLQPLIGLPITATGAWFIGFSANNVTRLVGVVCLLWGLGLLSTPWWVVHRSRRTVYLLTDQRALILSSGAQLLVQSYAPASLQEAECRPSRGGYGDVIFQPAAYGLRGTGFLSIPECRRVHALVLQLARNRRRDEGG